MIDSRAIGRLLSIVIVIAIISLTLGATILYNPFSAKVSSMNESLTSQLTTYTTVTRTTLGFGGSTYATTTGLYSGCIPPVQCYPTTVTTEVTRIVSTNKTSTTSKSSEQTSLDTTFTTNFYYWITINYNGSWRLVYWGWNGTLNGYISCAKSIPRFCLTPYNPTQDNVRGNLTGSGDYTFRIVTYGIGYVQNTLCANATKTDSLNLTLALTVLGTETNTTASNPTAVACGTYGV